MSGSFLLGDPLLAVGDQFFERAGSASRAPTPTDRSCVHTGSHTTRTSTLSTPVQAVQPIRDRGGHAGHERAPAGREDEVDLDVSTGDAHVLDHAHVDDADAPVGAARVVHVAQRVADGRGRDGVRLIARPHSIAMRKPVVEVGRSGSADSARAHRTPHAVSRYDPPRTVRQPSSSAGSPTHSHTLPASCSAPHAAAPPGWAPTETVQPQPDSTLLHRSGSNTSPQGHGRASRPRAAASHSSPRRQPDPTTKPGRRPGAELDRIGVGDLGGRMVGELLGLEPPAQRRANRTPGRLDERPQVPRGHRPTPDQHRVEVDDPLTRRRPGDRRPPATGTHESSGGTPRVRSGDEDTVAASTVANQTYTDAADRHKQRFRAHADAIT